MACEKCDEAYDERDVYPFRIGNQELGYATIGILACQKHAALVMERLRENNAD